MSAQPAFGRVAVVVHPKRDVEQALVTLRRWTEERGLELLQVATDSTFHRQVAPFGAVGASDLVVALGGDGTVLTALRAVAATNTPVLGVACGSLGALSAVAADELAAALERFEQGDWTTRALPALAVAAQDGAEHWAINDFVAIRRGTAQLAATVTVDDELYVRLAGDGLIVATPLGSTAYSMAAGGPVIATDTSAFLCTPLAMHGGTAPPLVIPATATLTIDVVPGYAGFNIELDGHRRVPDSKRFRINLHEAKATLVTFAEPGHGIAAIRRRRLIADSPRILARDDRAARLAPSGKPASE